MSILHEMNGLACIKYEKTYFVAFKKDLRNQICEEAINQGCSQ